MEKNTFIKGIVSDINPNLRKSDSYVDAVNARILKRPEGGYVLSAKGSNEKAFEIPPGYIIIGYSVYNRIAYLLLVNDLTGSCQIGTFPSPNYAAGSGFVDTYNALQNFTLDAPWEYANELCDNNIPSNVQAFQTNLLEFSLDHRPTVITRGEFDGSVNIYWTDFNKPIRVVNSGFNANTGAVTNQYTSEKEIKNGFININTESNYHTNYELINVTNQGSLKGGNYFITCRYIGSNFSSSSFLNYSSPISVGKTVSNNIKEGTEAQGGTNKAINILITGLDPDAAFVEIGYLYYFDDNSFEARIISGRYTLDGTGQLELTITGNEDYIASSADELIAVKPTDATFAKDIAQVNNYMYLYNTKGVSVDHPDLRKLACAIEARPTYQNLGNALQITTSSSDVRYQDPKEIYDNLGYFSGEIYAFAVIPILKGGFYGIPIPISAADFYNGVAQNPNEFGYLRFPNAGLQPPTDGSSVNTKAVEFITAGAQAIYDNSQWLQENVVGFYFARAKRKPSMLYQGILMHCYDGNVSPYLLEGAKPGLNVEANYRTNRFIPLYESRAYGFLSLLDPIPSNLTRTVGELYYQGDDKGIVAGKMGLIGIDYILDKREVADGYLQRYTNVSLSTRDNDVDRNAISNGILGRGDYSTYLGDSITSYNPYSLVGINVNTTNVLPWQSIPSGSGFVSRFEDGRNQQANSMYHHWLRDAIEPERNREWNLPIAAPAYIGIENVPNQNPGTPDNGNWRNSLCAFWSSDPNTIDYMDIYDSRNENYFPIGDFIPINTFFTNVHRRYNGDCFIARQYVAITRGHVESFSTDNLQLIADADETIGLDPTVLDLLPSGALPKGYGHWVSFICETKYNPNYRPIVEDNKYYPAVGLNNPGENFAWQLDAPESDFSNGGYQRVLQGRSITGLDYNRPTSTGENRTRLRISARQITGSILDSYRIYAAADFYDLDYSFGQGMRLLVSGEKLYSIQEHAINLHPINERQAFSGTEGSIFTNGGNQPLPQYRMLVSDKYGIQHKFAACVAADGIHLYDHSAKTWIRIPGNSVEDLATTNLAQSWLHANVPNPDRSDIIGDIEDKPLRRIGFSMDYHEEYKEVILTSYQTKQSLVHSAMIGNFVSRWSQSPILRIMIGRNMYIEEGLQAIYREMPLNTESALLYFDTQQEWYLRVCVAPAESEVLRWDAVLLNSNNVEYDSIGFETLHQEALQEPFRNANEFWYYPEFRENQWKLPIRRCDTPKNNELSVYDAQSPMRGRWLYIDLKYKKNSPMWLSSIITKFILSKA